MDNAIKTCKYIIDCNFKFSGAYHLMCNIYLRQNDVANAEKTLLKLIDVDQLDDAGVQQLIQIYKAEGLDDRGAYRKLYKKMATSLSSINAMYEIQLQNSTSQLEATKEVQERIQNMVENFADSAEGVLKYREQVDALTRKVSELNNVYGNMLAAMQTRI